MVTQARPKLETRSLTGVEILAPGKWSGKGSAPGGDSYTVRDLQQMAEAFPQLKGKIDPAGKLGHDGGQAMAQADGYPAIGWVSNVYVQNGKLYADFTDIPAKVADLIEARAYNKVSSEIYMDLEIDGKVYPRVLKNVAFLGADMPAVKDIKSISDVANLYQEALVMFAEQANEYAISADERRSIDAEDFAGPNRTFPIDSQEHLDAAAHLIGKAANPAAVKAKAIAIAKRKGLKIPDAWSTDNAEATNPFGNASTESPNKERKPDDDGDEGGEGDVDADGGEGDMAEDEYASVLAAHDAYCDSVNKMIAGKPGAKRIRTFLGTTRRELAAMKPRTPFANHSEVEMNTKELAELLGLPDTATEEQVKAAIVAKKAPAYTETELAEVRSLRQEVTELREARLLSEVTAIVEKGLGDGVISPAEKPHLVKMGLQDQAWLREYISAKPKLTVLWNSEGHELDAKAEIAEKSAAYSEIAKQMGGQMPKTESLERAASGKATVEFIERKPEGAPSGRLLR